MLPPAGKKRYGAALRLSNLINIGKKKPSALEGPEKTMETSGRWTAIGPCHSRYIYLFTSPFSRNVTEEAVSQFLEQLRGKGLAQGGSADITLPTLGFKPTFRSQAQCLNPLSHTVPPHGIPVTTDSRISSIQGYLNVLANSQWRTRWCTIKNGQLWFYQDKGKTKVAQQPLGLEGCMVVPDPSPEHLYSFTIQQDGEHLATLEVGGLWTALCVGGHYRGMA